MKNKLIKNMQKEFDSGESLQTIFTKYKSDDIKDRKLAYIVSTLKDKELIAKYKRPKNILVGFMFIIAFLAVLMAYSIGVKPSENAEVYWVSMAITAFIPVIPILFLYGFLKSTYRVYLFYVVLTISFLPKSIASLSSGNTFAEIGFIVSMVILVLVLYLKNKVYPYMGLLGPKKGVADQYLVVK